MLPSHTDVVALLGIDLVVCAGCLHLLNLWRGSSGTVRPWTKWAVSFFFVLLWVPAGAAALPVLAYIRGVSSDLSITLVALACASLWVQLHDLPDLQARERSAVLCTVAAAAIFLYPLALGWGDWDAYRPGWGAPGMLLALLALVVASWARGLRLLPLLIALALLAWTAALMESGNIWDYLMDPWLAVGAIFYCAKAIARKLLMRFGLLKT